MNRRRMTMGEIAPSRTATPRHLEENDQVWLLNLDQIEPHTGVLLSKQMADLKVVGNSTNWFDETNVLYSKLRPYLNKVYLPNDGGLCTTELVPLKPDTKIITREYLAHYLRSESFLRWVNEQVDGAKMPRVSMKIFWGHEIALPSIEEQKRITSILDKADCLRSKRLQTIQLADDFLRATFLDMFGDPVTNPKRWPVKKLAQVGTLDRGISKHRPRNDPSLLGGPYPLIQTGEVANCDGYIRSFSKTYSEKGLLQSKLWPTGTLCITIAANIAKTGILKFDACFPDSIVGFNAPKNSSVEYVRFWLSFLQKSIEENAPESAQKNINLAILRELNIPWPSPKLIEDFCKIVDFQNKIKLKQDAFSKTTKTFEAALNNQLLSA